jgi:hypothetical protein
LPLCFCLPPSNFSPTMGRIEFDADHDLETGAIRCSPRSWGCTARTGSPHDRPDTAMAVSSQGYQTAPYRLSPPREHRPLPPRPAILGDLPRLARGKGWNGRAVPAHVEREFRQYLECGILTCALAQARCGECGHYFLVRCPVSDQIVTVTF